MNNKKIISCVVAVAVACGGVSVSAAFPDVPEWAYYSEAVTETAKQGLFTGDHQGNFNPGKEVTRAEFAVLMHRFSGERETAKPKEIIFSDVTQDHWSAEYVASAVEKGILHGYDDGTFRPDEPVTEVQAVKMTVCALGYGDEAEELGNYPEGYIKLAHQKGLTEEKATDENQLRQDTAVLLYNGLNLTEEEPPVVSGPSGGGSSSGGGGGNKPSKPDKEEKPEPEGPEESQPEQPEMEQPEAEQPEAEQPETEQPETEEAPSWEGLNLKQEESDSCTASALTMLLRRLYYTNGQDFSHITESSLKADETIWHPDLGLYYEINFEGVRVVKRFFENYTDKVHYFKEQLLKHPEGMIIYSTGAVHAVVLTDYRNGIFYATDPATGLYTPLSDVFTMWGVTQEEKLENIDAIWIVER